MQIKIHAAGKKKRLLKTGLRSKIYAGVLKRAFAIHLTGIFGTFVFDFRGPRSLGTLGTFVYRGPRSLGILGTFVYRGPRFLGILESRGTRFRI